MIMTKEKKYRSRRQAPNKNQILVLNNPEKKEVGVVAFAGGRVGLGHPSSKQGRRAEEIALAAAAAT